MILLPTEIKYTYYNNKIKYKKTDPKISLIVMWLFYSDRSHFPRIYCRIDTTWTIIHRSSLWFSIQFYYTKWSVVFGSSDHSILYRESKILLCNFCLSTSTRSRWKFVFTIRSCISFTSHLCTSSIFSRSYSSTFITSVMETLASRWDHGFPTIGIVSSSERTVIRCCRIVSHTSCKYKSTHRYESEDRRFFDHDNNKKEIKIIQLYTNRLSKSVFSPQGYFLGRSFGQNISFSSTIMHKLLCRIKLELLL